MLSFKVGKVFIRRLKNTTIGAKIEEIIDFARRGIGRPEFNLGQKLRFDFIYGMIRIKECVIENAILYNEKGKKEGYLDLLEEDFKAMATNLLDGEKIFVYYGTNHMQDTSDAERLAYIVEKGRILFIVRSRRELDYVKIAGEKFPKLFGDKSVEINSLSLEEAKRITEKARGK